MSEHENPIVADLNPPVHVVPAADSDQVAHDLDPDCVCGPSMVPVKREDGSVGWICTHHSLDGREQREGAGYE